MLIRSTEKKDIAVLSRIAKEILEPLYGDQSKALNEWITGKGYKHAFVPVHANGSVMGLLSLKANPKRSYLKIATLLLLPEFQGNGNGVVILKYAEMFALENGYGTLIVTVSETKQESISFFQKNGFTIVSEEKGKYIDEISEFIMQKEITMKDFRFKRKYFMMVESGDKTLEARINYPFVKKVNENEVMLFFWEHRRIKVRIKTIRRYDNFKEMLDNEDVEKLVPGMSKEEALAEYQKIYPAEKVKRYGGVSVFAFEIVG